MDWLPQKGTSLHAKNEVQTAGKRHSFGSGMWLYQTVPFGSDLFRYGLVYLIQGPLLRKRVAR